MNTPGLSILAFLIVVVLASSRRWAALGMVAGVLFLTEGEAINLFGFNLYAIRFLEVAGFARVMLRKEFVLSAFNKIDKFFLWFYGYTTIVFLLRSSVNQAYMIGEMVDAVFCYFTFRGLIQNTTDLKDFLSSFPILLIPYFFLVGMQYFTDRNPFIIVGGKRVFDFRNGIPRCSGSFRHSIMLGSLGATFIPLYIGYILEDGKSFIKLFSLALCLGLVFFSNSSGPIVATGVALGGWLLWPLRNRMALFRRALAAMIFLLVLVMKSPIWYLPARLGGLIGGGGWHRSKLMDVAFQNIDKWWLAGMPILETRHWFPYVTKGTGAADITNQYLYFGIHAGLGSMILFIVFLIKLFSSLGTALVRSKDTLASKYLLWGLGVVLSVHVANWISVRYYDQFYVVWFLQLAMIVSCCNFGICLNSKDEIYNETV